MLGFIRMQPAIVERLLANITSPAVVDLLIRIIQCEDNADGQGVLGVSQPREDMNDERQVDIAHFHPSGFPPSSSSRV